MATALKYEHEDDVNELSDKEAKELFESTVRARLNISAQEFLQKFDADEFKGREEEPQIMRLLSLLPLVR